jgi:hypothetical protein
MLFVYDQWNRGIMGTVGIGLITKIPQVTVNKVSLCVLHQ